MPFMTRLLGLGLHNQKWLDERPEGLGKLDHGQHFPSASS
jgi:hypothetical protein